MKEKTKKIIKLLCILLLLISMGTGGYTYAKYRTAINGNGGAEIAKWSFKAGGENSTEIQNITLTNSVDKSTLVNGKIAPGTSGQFFVSLDATGSETSVEFEVKFANEKNKPANIIFTYESKDYSSLSEIDKIKGTIDVESESKTRKIQILWRWEYQTGTGDEISANDVEDTVCGDNGLDYSFDVIVTGTQSR